MQAPLVVLARALPCAALLAPLALGQQYARNTADVPASGGYTENVDFADVDLDGDWDAVFADGGDAGNDQNKIWINAFNATDPVGRFTNRTAQQFPAFLDDSRDIEFSDIDADGDPDLYVSNTSQIVNQSNRWWVNLGGAQAGAAGFYQDQTATRWSGLAQAGSSLPASLLIAGGFVDFSCDCDFGDLDNDGDIDLVHSTYGGAFNGNAPTRIFLNDGAGVFREFNPSGFQLAGINIANGNAGLWCQGTQSANTTNANGTNCDIASSALDIDVGDIDGDFDLDILHGARQELPRMFANLHSQLASLAFRDVTGSAFPPNYSSGGGHYEQEMADQDGDGDLDIYGLNWVGFTDAVYENLGSAVYGPQTTLSNSGSDDNEGDFIDYDVDGDLDLFIANFSGQERMYRNDGAGTYTYMSTGTVLPSDGTVSLDADTCDVDSDGDPDVIVANDNGAAQWYLQNGTAQNDVTPPSFPLVEAAPARVAGPAPTVVRAQLRDNASYYINWYDHVQVEVTVDGGPPATYPARTTQGDTVRAEIPGALVGTVCYRFVGTDAYGNTGSSIQRCFVASAVMAGTPYCAGDGSGTACPCGNSGAPGRGCANSLEPSGARLSGTGVASLAADTLVLAGAGMPNSSALYFQGTSQVNGGNGAAFGDGLRCAGGTVFRLGTQVNAGGASSTPQAGELPISLRGAVGAPGSVRTYQIWYRNAASYCTVDTFNLSNGLVLTWGA
jgi:hypothetical protein